MLLVAGLVLSQVLPGVVPAGPMQVTLEIVRLATMLALAFIMVHVGFEFDINKSRIGDYGWDYVVAATAAAFPWIFVALYFVFVLSPSGLWSHPDLWKEKLLESRFASPTSAGVLFSMLAAAGLATTWVFLKARVLAIFDDLDTILLMIPLKMAMVGMKWQLAIIVLVIVVLLWVAYRWLHEVRIPITWPWVLAYCAGMTAVCEAIHLGSKLIDPAVPIHLEILLPAFVLGCVIARPTASTAHGSDADNHAFDPHHDPTEQRVSMIVSAIFMLLVGLSMPAILSSGNKPDAAESLAAQTSSSIVMPTETSPQTPAPPAVPPGKERFLKFEGASPEDIQASEASASDVGWGWIAFHVLVITIISNVGKMFPAFCYRKEATFLQRLALSICMFPRGEVGAGVLVVSLSYGLGGATLTIAMLSLALNLVCTGLFIVIVKKLLAKDAQQRGAIA
jgi:hypothetical protein